MKNAPNGIGIMENPPEQSPDEQTQRSLTRIKNKIMIMSGKGGVGKSSVSVNLAIALAEKKFKVGLMDVDIHGPDIPRMMGLKGMMTGNANKRLDPMRYSDNLSAVSFEHEGIKTKNAGTDLYGAGLLGGKVILRLPSSLISWIKIQPTI